jgi:hypothetical protein
MPTITVNTSSTSFGTLPSQLNQLSDWINQTGASSSTIAQSESADAATIIAGFGAFSSYVTLNGVGQISFTTAQDEQITAGPYLANFDGAISSTGSTISSASVYDTATGEFVSESGTFYLSGYPLVGTLEPGSTLTSAAFSIPNPVNTATNLLAGALLDATWSGSEWSGTASAWYQAFSDTADGQNAQVNFLQSPADISIVPATATSSGSVTLAPATVDGLGVDFSQEATGATTDSILISGFSAPAGSVPASQALENFISGNDVVSISGNGSLDVLAILVTDGAAVNSVTLYDSASNVEKNLNLLETLSNEGKLSSITLTDLGTPTLSVTSQQATADAAAIQAINSPYTLSVNGVIACFAAGTPIATSDGEVAVEKLRVGVQVCLVDGSTLPVVWMGHRQIRCRVHSRPADVFPVRVAAHAFGMGRPRRDVWLSPDHAIYEEGVLIPIRHLLNAATIRQDPVETITYWHVELERHSAILAAGLATESYLDTGNRFVFMNGGVVVNAEPDFARVVWKQRGFAAIVTEGNVRDEVYRRLIVQALALGWRPQDVDNGKLQWISPVASRAA